MIKNLKAYSSLDSTGSNAVTIRVFTDKGSYSASVPVKGDQERLLNVFSSIRPNFIGLDEKDWRGLDAFLQELIPTEKPLSLVMSLALASSGTENNLWKLGTGKDFPSPLVNVISNKDMQEFLIIPSRAKSPEEAANTCLEVYSIIFEELKKGEIVKGRSPDGSWFCNLNLLGALEFLCSLAEDWDLKIGLDFSASGWDGRGYKIGPKMLSPSKYLDFIEDMSYTYRIYYLEDPFHKEDFDSFSMLTEKLGKKRFVIGNELYQSQKERLQKGIILKSGNGIVIRPVQAGALSDILNLSRLARKGKMFPIISQSLRETGDSWLSDISLLSGSPLLKTGLSGSERLSKLNRLIELWHEIPGAGMAQLP